MQNKQENSSSELIVGRKSSITSLAPMLEEIDGLSTVEPVLFGLPDLIFCRSPNESAEHFRRRREETIRGFVEEKLYLMNKGKRKNIKLIDEQLRLMVDMFYGDVKKAIVWKNRGGGGSLCAAIIIWLSMIYFHKSFTDMAGSGAQAKVVYEYVKQFWYCVPETLDMLDDEPMMSLTRMKDGTSLQVVATSESQARGKHPEGLICDEASQKDPRKDEVLRAAMQMVFTHTDYILLFLSTFHHPIGLFQEVWDEAKEREFERYRWDVYDTMMKCEENISCKDCELTRRVTVYDMEGNPKGYKWQGCNGKARNSNGFMPRSVIVDAFRSNDLELYETEYECIRPRVLGPVYNPDLTDEAYEREIKFEENEELEKTVGIDWGWATVTAVILSIKGKAGVEVRKEQYYSEDSAETIIGYLKELRGKEGNFKVYPDSSHPFENDAVSSAGFDVTPVHFNVWKEYGIKNAKKYLETGKVVIGKELTELRRCLKAYHRDEHGKPVKKDDHAPDAFMLSLIGWDYQTEFRPEKNKKEEDVKVRTF